MPELKKGFITCINCKTHFEFKNYGQRRCAICSSIPAINRNTNRCGVGGWFSTEEARFFDAIAQFKHIITLDRDVYHGCIIPNHSCRFCKKSFTCPPNTRGEQRCRCKSKYKTKHGLYSDYIPRLNHHGHTMPNFSCRICKKTFECDPNIKWGRCRCKSIYKKQHGLYSTYIPRAKRQMVVASGTNAEVASMRWN